jgi:AraC-like DNA-binding protein
MKTTEENMLFKNRSEKELSSELFKEPTKEYRATPFWAWNNKLDEKLLLREIGQLKEMGMGGAHIHCRVGLDTEYLGDEFFELVKSCNEEMKKQDMLCWLYDEDRWPSGSAGGLVTKEEKFRSRFLVVAPAGYEEAEAEGFMSAAKAIRSSNRTLLGKYLVHFDESGFMTNYQKVDNAYSDNKDVWEAYLEISGDTPWFNNQAYVNTLDKNAIDCFIQITHEKYYGHLKEDFGTNIPAIFTDEPQTSHKECLKNPFVKEPVTMPFTDDFEETFRQEYGCSILEHLPELIWEHRDKEVSQIRYYYHRHVCERFSEAFGDNVGTWCKEHNISLTGHMMNEWTLHSQAMAIGECMRPMKNFHIPGVDMLCDRRELSTVKQAQSIAHQMEREGVLSEIYGVTGWDFDFRNHKLAGDWQAALGVTVRVPHLTWVSMEGEGKRDYPASIGYQSPWYKEYNYIEDHFARLNTAMTRGVPVVSVGVLHPIESYWLYWGNQEQTAVRRQVLETNFEHLIDWLLYGLIDFDFISEAVLSEETQSCTDSLFPMGAMKYQVIVVPECYTLRSSTLDKLKGFERCGGKVIFMGNLPKYLDARKSQEPEAFAKTCIHIPYNFGDLLKELETYRDIDISVTSADGDDHTKMVHKETGTRTSNMIYQLRQDGDDKWLFLCHVNKPVDEHITYTEELKIKMKGEYQPVVYDTMSGEIYKILPEYKDGYTHITYYCSLHDSLLLKLMKRQESPEGIKSVYALPKRRDCLQEPGNYYLEEENVYLLDLAEYSFDNDAWQEEEEILRIDNLLRQKLNYPLRMEALAQPWVNKVKEDNNHKLGLRFRVFSYIHLDSCMLAMENADAAEICWNGQKVEHKNCGWYVDESIQKVALPELNQGENLLELWIPFGPKVNVEWCYLLGDFGVQVFGRRKEIIKAPEKIYYGDFTRQGLPFYAGNLIYEIPVTCKAGHLYIEASHYRGALIQCEVDNVKKGNIALAPYRLDCGYVEEGRHVIRLKIFGNRINAFGALHNADASESWYGPNIWRTTDEKWSYEYQLKEMGILTAPRYWIES